MKSDLVAESKKITVSKTKLLQGVALFWKKIYKTIVLILFVAAISLGAYIWRSALSGGGWSEERKSEYLNSQNKSVIFNEKSFEKALADLRLRKSGQDNQQPVKDIFKDY